MILTICLLMPNQLLEENNVYVNQSYTDKKPPLHQDPKGIDKKLQLHLFSDRQNLLSSTGFSALVISVRVFVFVSCS